MFVSRSMCLRFPEWNGFFYLRREVGRKTSNAIWRTWRTYSWRVTWVSVGSAANLSSDYEKIKTNLSFRSDLLPIIPNKFMTAAVGEASPYKKAQNIILSCFFIEIRPKLKRDGHTVCILLSLLHLHCVSGRYSWALCESSFHLLLEDASRFR